MENSAKKEEKIKEIVEKVQNSTFFMKYNPYKPVWFDEEKGKILDSQGILYYREFAKWLIDIHLNGIILNFVLAVFGVQHLHYFYVLANGLTIWIIYKLLGDFKEGISSIVRGMIK